jgi:Ni/Fe-hydrogenase subunit HybB-like protein
MNVSSYSVAEKVISDLLPQKFGKAGIIWTSILIVLCFAGMIGYYRQLTNGLSVTGMRDYASWGIYISNFVFFVAISLVGSLITAIFRLTNVGLRTPLTRIAEIIAVSAIMFAGLIIIVDMGRPERFVNLFVHGRLQSPIIWDVIVISTYLVLSLLFLYFPLLPDMPILIKNSKEGSGRQKFYKFIGSFWNGSPAQMALSEKSITIISVMIIPVALAIHTVTSWLFATTYRPGWDSTNFGAYFVSGAFLVGAGGVVVAMYIFRRAYKLDAYITEKHFDFMGKIVVMLALLYLYFNINEYLVPAFKMKKAEEHHLHGLFTGEFSLLFWTAILIGMVFPVIALLFPKGRKPLPMFVIGVAVVVGAWFKRFLIVTPTMLSPFLPMYDVPESYMHYWPTWEEWAITIGSLAGALLIITAFVRFFPIIPIRETIEEAEGRAILHGETASNGLKQKAASHATLLLALFMVVAPSSSAVSQGDKKKTLSLNLAYYQRNSDLPILKVTAKTKPVKKFEPVEGIDVNLFLNEEMASGFIAKAKTNMKGEASVRLPIRFKSAWDSASTFLFIAAATGDNDFEDVSTEIEITKARIELTLEEEDSVRTISAKLTALEDGWVVVPETEMKLTVKRSLADINAGEEDTYTTDETGECSAGYSLVVPGDKDGNIFIGAKIEDHELYGSIETSQSVKWGTPLPLDNSFAKRTLFATRDKTPLWLLIFPNAIIAGVWGAILFLLYQIFKIKKLGSQSV